MPGVRCTRSPAAMIGKALAPLLAPLGFNWQIAVALGAG
jgi:ferrous iron transport protein B